PVTTPSIAFPPEAPLMEDSDDIVNFVLLGADSRGDNLGRTDVVILVSLNLDVGNVAMWHIPRDLLVYVPGYTVDRINTVYNLGAQEGWPTGGAGLMKETIRYNFGIEVDYYARVNFSDFEAIIEQLGGLQISVDCQIEDWALISPDLDPTVEENWEQYTMGIGRQTLSPYFALWYARSRVTTSDLDRGRRQIDILRAMFVQSQQLGLFEQVTELFPQALEIVDTDMTLDDILRFLPVANTLNLNDIERFNGVIGVHYTNFTTPDDGRATLLPDYAQIFQLARDFVTPPTGNRLDLEEVSIEINDGSAFGLGFDLVASDRLAWEGFLTFPQGQIPGRQLQATTIYDYTGATKGSALERIMEIMRIGDSQVVFEPDPNRQVDFRIDIGTGYNSCILGSSADDLGPPVDEFQDTEDVETDGEPTSEPETVG
ncbi:MAG: LCP family protein, partial [Anaerolineales bacterium]